MSLRIIQTTQTASEEINNFLSKNLIGTPQQSPVYQQLSTRQKLAHIPKAHFATLWKAEQLLSTCCFCEREAILEEQAIKSYYVRYFSLLDQFRIQRRKTNTPRSKNSLIKSEIHEMLTGTGLGSVPGESNIFYAYVDPNNARSALLCEEFGFQPIRQFTTHIIGRVFPKKRVDFKQVSTKEDHIVIRQLLKKQYADYSFYTEENLFYQDNYFVIKSQNGEILAGIQANPEKWKIHSLPGISGRFLLNFLGRLPIFRRLIQANYAFLAFDYVYAKHGHEDLIIQLIESLLVHFQVYSAMILSDDQSPLTSLISTIDHGLIGQMKKPVSISVIIKDNNLEASRLKYLKKHPVFLSSFDTT
ncbi:hypothetical protein N6H18_00760 [Reichenbachiella agarivorans]|uniref:Acetyltransferase (GNAT) domain-containing protein n=1 Tax=Reichenbachiella agarivorans TaxID=2979464 RepID=A0ABY6CPR3_9BACT|nr:hypothetical protein [Reichenbachiella agarivorans]UXP32506.1 hypothetical protein N6H18_00760 [Reichenbachiella agarivorans]